MKSEKLIDAIGMIDDRYISEAHEETKKKSFSWNWNAFGRFALAAACLVLVVTLLPKVLFKGAAGGYYANNMDGDLAAPAAYDSSLRNEGAYYEYEADEAYYAADGASLKSASSLTENKKLIVTGDLNMETMDLDPVLKELDANIEKYGGYVQNSSISTSGSYRSYRATIRIPAEEYRNFLGNIESSGNVTYYHENTSDITDTYTDLDARMTSLKAEEERILEFYKEAETIEDLMSIESRLTDIRYEIDSISSRLKNYDLLVSYSTLNIYINETKAYTETSVSFFKRLTNAFSNGWKNFISGIEDFFIDVVYYFWNIILFAVLVYAGYRVYKYIRKRRNG
ncbi:MAG: DUF4349 domain-containing protein [Erysipelotrichaceae bacterium]|nr:DUF4349 domain-containing protein [Erysipelotrichaceae bacterium]